MGRKQLINEHTITAPLTKLLCKAEELFANQGYTATTIRQIAGATKVNGASIIYHFGNKEALYNLIFTIRMKDLTNAMEQIEQSKKNIEKLDAFIDTYISHIQKYKNFHKLMLREYCLLSSFNQERSIIRQQILDTLSFLKNIVTQLTYHDPPLQTDVTLFSINIIMLTPRLVIETDLSGNIIDILDDAAQDKTINVRIKKYFYSQFFGKQKPV
jgi:AcrR family transcriptional regulator